ncbi:MAG: MFS transporter, partial [Eubacteriales bacterium]|nr:MFS transporter [Eubacteriales bacterium]
MERWKVNLYTLWVTQVFSLMGFGFCIPFVPFFLQDLGVSDPVQLSYYVGLSSTLPAATMAVAAPVWGIASDRYGRKMMIMRAMFFAAVLLALMGLSQSVFQFMVLRALQGVFTGTVTASMSFVSANTPENRISYALGLMTSSNFLGYSVGPFIGGMIAELLGYRICFAIGGGLMTIGFFLVVFLVKEDKNTYGYRIRSEEGSKGKRLQVLSPFIVVVLISLLFQRISRSVFVPFIPLYVQETLGTMVGAATYTGIISGATGFATALA